MQVYSGEIILNKDLLLPLLLTVTSSHMNFVEENRGAFLCRAFVTGGHTSLGCVWVHEPLFPHGRLKEREIPWEAVVWSQHLASWACRREQRPSVVMGSPNSRLSGSH